jgi:glycerol-3-phosphate dehydrogenase
MDYHTEVVVIGGGVTGAGIARDLVLRGIETILIEKGDLAAGATGRCHGLLHSGGRYVVKDPESAAECISENQILKKIASATIEDTGGLFVGLSDDDSAYRDKFLSAAEKLGIETQPLTPSQARRFEPNLSEEVDTVIRVPDAAVDPFALTVANAQDVTDRGGSIFRHTELVDFIKEKGKIRGAVVLDHVTGERHQIRAQYVVNATGGWAEKVAHIAGAHVPLSLYKGSLLVFNRRINNAIINRLRLPGDGDIIVPNEPTTIIGTTSILVSDPDDFRVSPEEVELLMKQATRILPPSLDARVIRAYAGIRPLLASATDEEGGRDISRSFTIINHKKTDSLAGLISIVGGKLTTYRLMAEKIVDGIAEELGVHLPCRSHELPLPGSEDGDFYRLERRFDYIEIVEDKEVVGVEEIVCECELVTKGEIVRVIRETGSRNLKDIQHRTRVGMGSCQGGFCTYRLLGILHELGMVPDYEANDILIRFLEERWRGIRPILWGDQLREEQLVEGIYLGIFALDRVGSESNKNQRKNKKP